MGIDTIIALGFSLIAAIAGIMVGHARGKSVGKEQGAAEATAGISLAQSQKAAKSAAERTNVEVQVAADSDDDLERRLQKHNRLD